MEDDIKLTGAPNDKYEKFFAKFSEIESLDPDQWKAAHILAYFCKKYKEQYNVDYKFKFNSPSPSKCFEVFQVKKLSLLLTSQPTLLKNYVDWVFLNKVVKAKRRITSISFMTSEGLMNEYKFNVLLAPKNGSSNIDRSTPLPDNYKSIFKMAGAEINTYGELSFLSQISDMTFEMIGAFQQIEEIGFDKNILTRIV